MLYGTSPLIPMDINMLGNERLRGRGGNMQIAPGTPIVAARLYAYAFLTK